MPDGESLERIIERIDGRGYRAYRELAGEWRLGPFSLHLDRIQADPFAAPSRLRLGVPLPDAKLPARFLADPVRRIATADFLARRARLAVRKLPESSRGSGRSGGVTVDAGGQQVLERSAVRIGADRVELRLAVGLPAAGRRVLGAEARELLTARLPEIARASLLFEALPAAELEAFVDCVENQEAVRARLPALGLVAFVGDGSLLPRESGASDRPLAAADAVPFTAPAGLRLEIPIPNPIPGSGARALTGLGIREGVTLVVGGGYHGKSTLLRALAHGIHPHVPGDGREWVVSRPDLVKIRAEDGRRVEGVDISAFVRDLPGGRSTGHFASDEASGSTSQAANIVEALEAGCSGLLIDEDTSATNFMVRDARMQALVSPEAEPIVPFVDRVRALHRELGVSSVLVMGGSGDYFEAADCVIRLRDFIPEDATAEAHAIAERMPTGRRSEAPPLPGPPPPRAPLPASFDASRGRRAVAIDAPGLRRIRFGDEEIDLSGVEQLLDRSQTRAVGFAIRLLASFADGRTPLRELLDRVDEAVDREGLDVLDPFHRPGRHPGDLARPRRFELAAAVNRLRSLRVADPTAAG